MFIMVLFIVVQIWKQSKWIEWVNKMWYAQTLKYHLAIKRNKVLMHSIYEPK